MEKVEYRVTVSLTRDETFVFHAPIGMSDEELKGFIYEKGIPVDSVDEHDDYISSVGWEYLED